MKRNVIAGAIIGAILFTFNLDIACAVSDKSGLSVDVNTDKAGEILYGGEVWKVIGYNGNGVVSNEGNITLLAKTSIGQSVIDNELPWENKYSNSKLKIAINAIEDNFTSQEKTAIERVTLVGGAAENQQDGMCGDDVEDAMLWPLSVSEATLLDKKIKIDSMTWWLRSPGDNKVAGTAVYGSRITIGLAVLNNYGVRPAFKLNESSIILISDSIGGKTTDSNENLNLVEEITDTQKLTIVDAYDETLNPNGLKSGDVNVSGLNYKEDTMLSVNIVGASENKAVSAIITDSNGAVKYYGKIGETNNDGEGININLKLPVSLDEDNKLKIFVENLNGDNITDYASEPKLINKIEGTDVEKLAKVKSSIEIIISNMIVNNDITDEDIISEIKHIDLQGINLEWDNANGFKKKKATSNEVGNITGIINLESNDEKETVIINKDIPKLPQLKNKSTFTKESLESSFDKDTGISVLGEIYDNIEVKFLVDEKSGKTNEIVDKDSYNKLVRELDKNYHIINVYKINCDDYLGMAKIIFPMEDKYNNRGYVVKQKKNDGSLVSYKGIIKNSEIVINLDEFSFLMVSVENDTMSEVKKEEPVLKLNAEDILDELTELRIYPKNFLSREIIVNAIYNIETLHNQMNTNSKLMPKDLWMIEKGISDGNQMKKNITREQFITMLWRNTGIKGVADYKNLEKFKDVDKISAYAKDAMAWANKNSIINGKSVDVIDPKGYVTYGEAIAILENYIKVIEI